MATNWADPLHLKSRFLSQVPGMQALDHFSEDNAAGRFLTNGPLESMLPREYQISSPWAGMQVDADKVNTDKLNQQQKAYAALANSPDVGTGQ